MMKSSLWRLGLFSFIFIPFEITVAVNFSCAFGECTLAFHVTIWAEEFQWTVVVTRLPSVTLIRSKDVATIRSCMRSLASGAITFWLTHLITRLRERRHSGFKLVTAHAQNRLPRSEQSIDQTTKWDGQRASRCLAPFDEQKQTIFPESFTSAVSSRRRFSKPTTSRRSESWRCFQSKNTAKFIHGEYFI